MIEDFGDISKQKEVKKLSRSDLLEKYYEIVKTHHIAGMEKAFDIMEMDKDHLNDNEFSFSLFMTLFTGHFEQYISEEILLSLYGADTNDIERLVGDTANAEYVDQIHKML